MEKYLDNINSPEDIKKLSNDKLNALCLELRDFLVDNVSKTGGHIASNLGVVELTVALHYAFNCPMDKIVWDVGHQSYVHKIFTGRKNEMSTLRQYKGLSGFPKRDESIYDVFDTGHSSTSISAAIGIARARDLKSEKYEVVAVIGDGALTGGMAFEALNDAGRSNTKLIVILNDNEMSISPNVGGLSTYLGKIRTEPRYISTKKDVEKIIDHIPFGSKGIKKFIKRTKDGIKKMVVTTGMLFEELGFTYMGPIDGHNIDELIEVFNKSKNINGPLLIHVKTIKGKGYKFAEERPNDFHGVSAFNIETGKSLNKSSIPSCSDVFGNKLCEIAEKDKSVVAITAAMTDGTGLKNFSKKFPKRLFDVGIAEQHAVTMAAGLAANGVIPVVTLYSSFLQRAYDQVIHDVAMQNLHVVFAIDRAGIVGNDGETHQGVFDSAFLCQIPNIAVMVPTDYRELENMLEYAIKLHNGPICIRYPRGSFKSEIDSSDTMVQLGRGTIVKEGSDLTIIASGKMVKIAIDVRDILKDKSIDSEIINLRFLKPLDEELILKSALKTKKVVIIDETVKDGSVALRIDALFPNNIQVLFKTLPDKFIKQGSIDELLKENDLNAESIAFDIKNKLF
ncbi:1-deoxy-D-xylulose-5-phosphate synthase [Sedimentibacter acidaminivorans]|uniref:1-deoxy-D-xylulose-5-phosphate synthase n=1 Tax=Sedimentibacter acidaminivorans TaxID=913099 RepID=A0ABS4GHR7_9FIRM|nr:1-deoxy-D-xylulose-5-phosphate synthase [Sedimentibacter acidaminivorans]MBP1927230.1 1-deoxy-D-xylulose-5-phosphate synthase [Sedimentibacter acidaminivorans]